jgi:hypothetical protein
MPLHVFDRDDFHEIIFEHPIEDLEREIGDQPMAHAKLAWN